MAARVVRNPAGGSNSLPDGSVHRGRGTWQLHDVTGKVQRARLIIAAQVRELRVAALDAHLNLKGIHLEYKKSRPRFRVDMISRGRGEIPPVFWAQDYTTS